MAGGQESARSTLHLAQIFRLADAAGLLLAPPHSGCTDGIDTGNPRGRRVDARSVKRSSLAVNQYCDCAQAGRFALHH